LGKAKFYAKIGEYTHCVPTRYLKNDQFISKDLDDMIKNQDIS